MFNKSLINYPISGKLVEIIACKSKFYYFDLLKHNFLNDKVRWQTRSISINQADWLIFLYTIFSHLFFSLIFVLPPRRPPPIPSSLMFIYKRIKDLTSRNWEKRKRFRLSCKNFITGRKSCSIMQGLSIWNLPWKLGSEGLPPPLLS